MILFNLGDFNVENSYQNNELRDKMSELEKELVTYAKQVCPNRNWDSYVTRKSDFKEQWGAIFPVQVKGNEEYISMWPNIFFCIPQDGSNVILAVNIEFKYPREMLIDHCLSPRVDEFLRKIKNVTGATVSIRRKEVLNCDKRKYKWTTELWNSDKFPDINVDNISNSILRSLPELFKSPVPHSNPIYVYEPLFLIKYEFTQRQIIDDEDIVKILGEKVKLLSPIIEYIFS